MIKSEGAQANVKKPHVMQEVHVVNERCTLNCANSCEGR
jgi:hypothetical protein